MMKINDFKKFLQHSYELMQNYEQGRRYYHTLTKNDNSPVVIRKNTNQITYVVEGSGMVYLNGEEKKISKENIILIKAGTTIRFVADSDELTLFHIHIPDVNREEDRKILKGDDFDYYQAE